MMRILVAFLLCPLWGCGSTSKTTTQRTDSTLVVRERVVTVEAPVIRDTTALVEHSDSLWEAPVTQQGKTVGKVSVNPKTKQAVVEVTPPPFTVTAQDCSRTVVSETTVKEESSGWFSASGGLLGTIVALLILGIIYQMVKK